ncbi:hypothetical protein BKA58DRAFT_113113 [Alternaria rosae]|uniref:uncharacterized protein n=1 Tax=Alternaria rosae TaxID=1187941 RepID=UPI001E8E8F8B|nr:uncharacterized protein BKA58DRAFT_113113 [Alternaria rosae]KAH6879286.1 hypothetical protein BKA58DRAFT_113113 [Alternaria rosae]
MRLLTIAPVGVARIIVSFFRAFAASTKALSGPARARPYIAEAFLWHGRFPLVVGSIQDLMPPSTTMRRLSSHIPFSMIPFLLSPLGSGCEHLSSRCCILVRMPRRLGSSWTPLAGRGNDVRSFPEAAS